MKTKLKFEVTIDSVSTRVMIPIAHEYEDRNRTPTELRTAAIDRAVEKLYGSSYFWFENHGVGWYCGQVFKSLRPTKNNSNPGNSAATSQICIDCCEI